MQQFVVPSQWNRNFDQEPDHRKDETEDDNDNLCGSTHDKGDRNFDELMDAKNNGINFLAGFFLGTLWGKYNCRIYSNWIA